MKKKRQPFFPAWSFASTPGFWNLRVKPTGSDRSHRLLIFILWACEGFVGSLRNAFNRAKSLGSSDTEINKILVPAFSTGSLAQGREH